MLKKVIEKALNSTLVHIQFLQENCYPSSDENELLKTLCHLNLINLHKLLIIILSDDKMLIHVHTT